MGRKRKHQLIYLAVVTTELVDDMARGDVPIEDLSVGSFVLSLSKNEP
jgi:hypothetical protein